MALTAEYRIALFNQPMQLWQPLSGTQLVGLQEIRIVHNHNEYSHYTKEIQNGCKAMGAFNGILNAYLFNHATAAENEIEIRLKDTDCNKYLPIIGIGQRHLSGCNYGCDYDVSLEFKDDLARFDKELPFIPDITNPMPIYKFPSCSDENFGWYMAVLLLRVIPLLGLISAAYFAFFGIIVTGCYYVASGFKFRQILDNMAIKTGTTHTDADNDYFKTSPTGTIYSNHAYVKMTNFQETWNCIKTLNFLKQEYNAKWRVDENKIRLFWKYRDWNVIPLFDLSDKNFCNEFIQGKGFAYFDPQIPPAKDNKYSAKAALAYNELAEWNLPYSTSQADKLSPDFEASPASFRLDGTAVDATRKSEQDFAAWTIFNTNIGNGFCDYGDFMRFSVSESSTGYIVDIDPNTPQLSSKAKRVPFTQASSDYYQAKGLEGEYLYNCGNLLTPAPPEATQIVNATVFVNEYLESLGFHNRYPLFAPENPRTAPISKRRKADIELTCMGCTIKNKLGIFEGDFSAIDCHIKIFKDETKAYIRSFTVDYATNKATINVEY